MRALIEGWVMDVELCIRKGEIMRLYKIHEQIFERPFVTCARPNSNDVGKIEIHSFHVAY